MGRTFLYGKQADIVAGSANFSALISSMPTAYGLVAAQATAFAAVNTALQSAYTAATTPSTRTPVTIEAKNDALRAMKIQVNNLTLLIYGTATVTDAQRVALGLSSRNTPGPQPIPTVAPVVEVVSVVNRMVKVRIHQADGGASRKPAGCVGAQIFSYVGNVAPVDTRSYHYEGLATRSTAEILFPDTVAGGTTVWISAGWLTARGFPCVACAPVQVTLQGGPVLAAAA